MVSPSTYSMVSALAGLQRLEAQISQALMQASVQMPNSTGSQASLQWEAEKSMVDAGTVIQTSKLDLKA